MRTNSRRNFLRAALVGASAVAAPVPLAATARAAGPDDGTGKASGEAPGGPGADAGYAPADKVGFGTSRTKQSPVWFTLQGGRMSETYYPDLSTPASRQTQLVVTDGKTFVERLSDVESRTETTGGDGVPAYRQTSRGTGWSAVTQYVTDPERASVLIDVELRSHTGSPLQVFVLHDPSLTGEGNDDRAFPRDGALMAEDEHAASALLAEGGFAESTVGYLGVNDGWTELRREQRPSEAPLLDRRPGQRGAGGQAPDGRPHPHTPDGRGGLRREGRGRAEGGAALTEDRIPCGGPFLRRRLALLPRRAPRGAGQPGRGLRPRPLHVLDRDAGRLRGQGEPRRVHRLAVDALGVRHRPAHRPGDRPVPPGVAPRPVPHRHRAARRRRPRRGEPRDGLPAQDPAARRPLAAELQGRRHPGVDEHPAGRDGGADAAGLAAGPPRRRDAEPDCGAARSTSSASRARRVTRRPSASRSAGRSSPATRRPPSPR